MALRVRFGPTALRYALVAASLLGMSVAVSVSGPNPFAVAPFVIAVAVYAVRGRPGLAAGLVGCALLSGLVALGDPRAGLFYGLGASVGLLLGAGIAKRWTYGHTVAVVTSAAFLVCVAYVLTAWEAWHAGAAHELSAVAAQVEHLNETPSADSETRRVRLEMYRWAYGHWGDISLGAVFVTVLFGTCVGLSGTAWWVRRRFGEAGPASAFERMRPPEWLVWLVIVTALFWFADRRWPDSILRPMTWNMAIALAAVYSLNGLAILVYAGNALQPPVLITLVVLVTAVYLGLHPLLCFLGLFDTWSEFRVKIDALAARRAHRHSGDEGP